jgi:inner membrane protein
MLRGTHQVGGFAAALGVIALAHPLLLGDAAADSLPAALLAFGAPIGLPIAQTHLPIPVSGLYVLSALAGALAPDLDKPSGPWGKMLVANTLGGHRHLSHCLLGAALAAALVYGLMVLLANTLGFAGGLLWLGFVVGYLSHILLDALTVDGVPWFYPLSRTASSLIPISELRVRTGGLVEQFLVLPALLMTIAWLGIDQSNALRGLWHL